MKHDVLILFTRYDAKNASLVEWIGSTLDAAGFACTISEGSPAGAARRSRLLIVPVAGSGWRGITNDYLYSAVSAGVPVLPVQIGDIKGFSWTTLQQSGALRDLLQLTDMSGASADRLVAAAWAKVQTSPLELNVAMYASPDLEPLLRQALSIVSDEPKSFGNRVVFRPILWPTKRPQRPHGAVCLLWHDLHTALGGNDWAINEWQTLASPSVLLFYRERPKDDIPAFEQRLGRLQRETTGANEFIEHALRLPPGSPVEMEGRSKAGFPAANFERQLREYLASRVESAVRSIAAEAKHLEQTAAERPRFSGRTDEWERTHIPDRFRDPLEHASFYIDSNSSGPTRPPREAVSQAHFAAFAPTAVEPGRPFLLEVWACQQGAYEAMMKMAQRRDGVSRRGSKTAPAPPTGTVLEVAIVLPSFTTAETIDTLVWTGAPANASFVMRSASDIQPGWHVGTATISVRGIPIARLRFEVQVGRSMEQTRDLSSHERRVSSIFASYASADRIEVLQWARGAETVGVSVFLDVLSLRESADWGRELFNTVPTKDLFCLFWSAPAKASVWVEREWRCALTARGLDYIHPVPLADPRDVPPPVELTSRHFGDPTLFIQQYEKLRGHLKAPPAST